MVKCWGFGWEGSLGNGDQRTVGDEPFEMGEHLAYTLVGSRVMVVDVVLGGYTSFAILEGGFVKCWGYNFDGNCGYSHSFPIGDNLGEMGDNLPLLDLGTGVRVSIMTSGDNHACAVLKGDIHYQRRGDVELEGKMKCWGQNYYGQLGYGDRENRGDDPGEMGDSLEFVDVGEGRMVRDVAAGNAHTCVILDGNEMKCWGLIKMKSDVEIHTI